MTVRGANEGKKGRLVVIANIDIVRSSVEAELLDAVMHVVFEKLRFRGDGIPMDLGQTPTDLVVLSFQ